MATNQSKRTRRDAARKAHRRRQRIRWAAAAVVTLAIVGTLTFVAASDNQAAALAPDFELETAEGETARLSDYRGQPVALIFMHTY